MLLMPLTLLMLVSAVSGEGARRAMWKVRSVASAQWATAVGPVSIKTGFCAQPSLPGDNIMQRRKLARHITAVMTMIRITK